jgi:hypothetical protein
VEATEDLATHKAWRVVILAELYCARYAQARAEEHGDTETLGMCAEEIHRIYDELSEVEEAINAMR